MLVERRTPVGAMHCMGMMVLRRAASTTAACLLFHRVGAFVPPCGSVSIQVMCVLYF